MGLKGTDGRCDLDGTSVDVTNWTYTGTINTAETTAVGDTDQEFDVTTRNGTGSLTLTFDADNAQQKVVVDQFITGGTIKKVLLQLFYDATNTDQLYFSAWITSADLPVGANDMDVLTVNFQKTGVLYHAPTT